MGHRFTKYRFAAKNSDLEKMGGREEKIQFGAFIALKKILEIKKIPGLIFYTLSSTCLYTANSNR